MSHCTRWMTVASIATAVLSASPALAKDDGAKGASSASANFGRFYLGTELGVSLLPSIKIKDHVATPLEDFGNAGVKADVDAGVAWNVEVGYAITDWFAMEFETGYYRNGFGGFDGGAFTSTFGDFPIAGGDGSISQIPLFLNAKFSIPLVERAVGADGGAVKLDLTAGLGAVSVSADIDGISAVGAHVSGVTAAIDGGSWEFGGQVGIGVSWEITSNVELGLGYRFMMVDGANLGPADFSSTFVGLSDVETESILTNAIQATLSIRF